MQLKYDELSSGGYEVRVDEKPLEHVLFADEEEGYCLLGATDLQGNLLPAADPDSGYPYETVRVDGAVRIALRTSMDVTRRWSSSGLLGVASLAGGEAPLPPVESPFANLDPTTVFSPVFSPASVPTLRLRTFGLKREISDAALQRSDWQYLEPTAAPPDAARLMQVCGYLPLPVLDHRARRVREWLRLQSVPGRAGRFTVRVDEEVFGPEYRLDRFEACGGDLQLHLEAVLPHQRAVTVFCIVVINNPQTSVQLHRNLVPPGPGRYDLVTGGAVPSVEPSDRSTLEFRPGVHYRGPLDQQQHWEILEGLLDSLRKQGAADGDAPDEETDDPGGGA